MKILAGEYRGRPIMQPKTRAVRPLSEKVRAALFDVVGNPVGFTILDVHAGSGAAGLEALSRGALLVEAIEANRSVARTIQQNIQALNLAWGYHLHIMTAESWLASPAQNPPAPRYQLIIADPPYAQLDPTTIDRLGGFLKPSGVLALSHSSKTEPPMLKSAQLVSHKSYGDTSLSFYQHH